MITIKNLSIAFDKETILKDLNFDFEKGKNYAIIGHNGQGKTTLLKEIFKSTIIDNEHIDVKSNKIYFSTNTSIKPHAYQTGYEYLITYLGEEYTTDDKKAKELDNILNYYNISVKLTSRMIAKMSGGEKRIFNLIVAIYGDWDIVLIDELESNLDSKNLGLVINALNEKNKTVIIATHSQKLLSDVKDLNILKIKNKKLIYSSADINNIAREGMWVINENFEF